MQLLPNATPEQRSAAADSWRSFQQRLFQKPNTAPKNSSPVVGQAPNGSPVMGAYGSAPKQPAAPKAPDMAAYAPGRASPMQQSYGTPYQPAPGYGGGYGSGGIRTMEFRDRDGDGVDDRDQSGPGIPYGVQQPAAQQPVPFPEMYYGSPMPQAPQGPRWKGDMPTIEGRGLPPQFQSPQQPVPAGPDFGQMFNFQGFTPAPPPPRPEPPPLQAQYYGPDGGEPRMVTPDFDFDEGRRIQSRLEGTDVYKRLQQRNSFDPFGQQVPYGIDDFTARTQGYLGDSPQAAMKRQVYNQRAASQDQERLAARRASIEEQERARTQQMRERAFAGPAAERDQVVAAQEAEYQQRLQQRYGAPGFTQQSFGWDGGSMSPQQNMAQRDAFIARLNAERAPLAATAGVYPTGMAPQAPPLNRNFSQMWSQAGDMVMNGWTNPLAGLFG